MVAVSVSLKNRNRPSPAGADFLRGSLGPFSVQLSGCLAVSGNCPLPDAKFCAAGRGQGADVAPEVELQLADFLAVQENVVAGVRFQDRTTLPVFRPRR